MNKELNAIDPTRYIGKALEKYNEELIGALSDGLLFVKEARRNDVWQRRSGNDLRYRRF